MAKYLRIKTLHQEVFLKLSDSVCATNEGLFLMLPWLAARQQGLDNFSGLLCGNVIVAPCSSSSVHNSDCRLPPPKRRMPRMASPGVD